MHSIGAYRLSVPERMRVPDPLLKCVGYVAEAVHSDASGDDLDLQATGFFVSIPSLALPGNSYQYFVTAKHVTVALEGRDTRLIVNAKQGAVQSLTVVGNRWYQHPSDRTADVAVVPYVLTPDLDVISVAPQNFATRDILSKDKIGIGDEVFLVGLFTYAPGRRRNMPMIRHGNLAMLPEEQIQVEGEFADAYLIELRSLMGLSGSPVFVRRTVTAAGTDAQGKSVNLAGVTGQPSDFRLLGLMHGHWDIRESEINRPSAIHDRQRGVNMGIGVVVPVEKILETLNQPVLLAQREEAESNLRMQISPGPD